MTYRRKEIIGDATLYLGDCLQVMRDLDPVDGALTSPPYDELRQYGEGFNGVDCFAVIESVGKLLNPGSCFVWNVADQTVNGSETGNSFRHALHGIECGLNLHDTMVYCKEGVTFPDANRYLPCFEYVFVFSNGKPKHFNGIRDWLNKHRGRVIHGTDREADGRTKPKSRNHEVSPDYSLRRNWWIIANAYNGETAGHPAPMPYALAHDQIKTWTIEYESVLDPFMGSGTTGVACAKLGRKFIGIEIEEKYFSIACERIEKAYQQPDFFIEPPKKMSMQQGALFDEQ